MISLFYSLVKTTKRYFGNIKHAKIKQVLSFKQVSVTLSNFLNRKNKKQEKKQVSEPPSQTGKKRGFELLFRELEILKNHQHTIIWNPR